MSAGVPKGTVVRVITLQGPDRTDGQEPCPETSTPTPVDKQLYISFCCSNTADHDGPHLWSWVWMDPQESDDEAAPGT
jgi:hypothetical protein